MPESATRRFAYHAASGWFPGKPVQVRRCPRNGETARSVESEYRPGRAL